MSLVTFATILLTIITLAIYWVRKRFSIFEEQGFLYDKPEFPYGNLRSLGVKYHIIQLIQKTYNKFSQKASVHGFFTFLRPTYVVTGLDVVKDVLIRNFNAFHNRGLFSSKEHDPLSAHLFTLEDNEWRTMRHKLTPTFTSGKMKVIFKIILDVSDHMIEKLKKSELENVCLKDVASNFMIDVIGNVAFGLEMNTIENPDSKFKEMGMKIFTGFNFFNRALLLANFRTLARKLGFRLLPSDISDFFRGLVRTTVQYRIDNQIERNDVLNLLMKIGNEGHEGEENLTMDEIAAQCFIFFIAGFETSSNASSSAMFHLVKNLEIQEKLREEIKSVLTKHNNVLTYECMQDMKYLEMIVNETLRILPPAGAIIRQASVDYHVPDTKLVIPKNSLVFIPVYLIHNDPNIYPEPEKFDPERFTPENMAKRHQMAFIPFGDGPRSCIGNRFGLMQTKITLIRLLMNFRFTATSKTPEEIIFNPRSPILTTKDPLIFRAEKLEND